MTGEVAQVTAKNGTTLTLGQQLLTTIGQQVMGMRNFHVTVVSTLHEWPKNTEIVNIIYTRLHPLKGEG